MFFFLRAEANASRNPMPATRLAEIMLRASECMSPSLKSGSERTSFRWESVQSDGEYRPATGASAEIASAIHGRNTQTARKLHAAKDASHAQCPSEMRLIFEL